MYLLFGIISSLVIILFYDDSLPHVARMAMIGHMLPGWQWLVTCCQDGNDWSHVARMEMIGHMLPGWHCKSLLIWDLWFFSIQHIFFDLSPTNYHFFKHLDNFFKPKTIVQKLGRNWISRFLGIKAFIVLFYRNKKNSKSSLTWDKILPHPLYSPDLSLTNYHFFFKHQNNFLWRKEFYYKRSLIVLLITEIHKYSGITFWPIKTPFKLIHSGIKVF